MRKKSFYYDDRWNFAPTAEDAGEHELVREVRDQRNEAIARGRTSVCVAASQPIVKDITMLAFGDSHLQRDAYLQRALDSSVEDPSLNLVLVGFRGAGNRPPSTELRHEGYSGWTAQAFMTRTGPKRRTGFYVPAETVSPFLYGEDGLQQLDFRQYCRDVNRGKAPDFVVVQVGGNDLWRADEDTIDETIDEIFGYYDILVEMVHNVNRKTRIGLTLLDPPSRSQHGFCNYNGTRKSTRRQYRRNQHRMVERQVDRYAGREKARLYLLPVNLCIDCVNGFPLREYSINARTTAKEFRVYDGCHLSNEGYAQFGDEIYAWVKCCLSEPAVP